MNKTLFGGQEIPDGKKTAVDRKRARNGDGLLYGLPPVDVMIKKLLIDEYQAQLPVARLGAEYVITHYPEKEDLDVVCSRLKVEYRIEFDKDGAPDSFWFRRIKASQQFA